MNSIILNISNPNGFQSLFFCIILVEAKYGVEGDIYVVLNITSVGDCIQYPPPNIEIKNVLLITKNIKDLSANGVVTKK